MKITKLLGTTAIMAVGFISFSATAQDSDIQSQINELKKQIAALEKATAEAAKVAKKAAVVKKADPAPRLATADGKYEMNMRGRVEVDFGWASGDNGNVNVDAAEFRAAWIGIEGKAGKNIGYKFEADFGANKVSMKDAYVTFGKKVKVTVGHSKITNSMELQTGGTQLNTMERSSMVNAFGFGRALGVKVGTSGDNWSLAGGVFRGGAGTKLNDEGLIFTGRGTYGVKMDGGTMIMGAASFRSRDMGDGTISYKARPGHHLTSSSKGASVSPGNSKDTFFGVELAAQSGPFHFGSEAGWLTADEAGVGGEDAKFYGGYAEVGFFLTGENNGLSLSKGSWGRPKVKSNVFEGGKGAWQIVGKFETLDLNDSTAGLYGGKMDTYIIGVNWYLNKFSRIVANYSRANSWSHTFDRDIDAFGLRFQVDW